MADPLLLTSESQMFASFGVFCPLRLECSALKFPLVTSNRDADEWLAVFDDALLAESAVDPFANGDSMIEAGHPCRGSIPASGQRAPNRRAHLKWHMIVRGSA